MIQQIFKQEKINKIEIEEKNRKAETIINTNIQPKQSKKEKISTVPPPTRRSL